MGIILIAVGILFILVALIRPLGYLLGLLFIVSGIMLLWSEREEMSVSSHRAVAGSSFGPSHPQPTCAEAVTPEWW